MYEKNREAIQVRKLSNQNKKSIAVGFRRGCFLPQMVLFQNRLLGINITQFFKFCIFI